MSNKSMLWGQSGPVHPSVVLCGVNIIYITHTNYTPGNYHGQHAPASPCPLPENITSSRFSFTSNWFLSCLHQIPLQHKHHILQLQKQLTLHTIMTWWIFSPFLTERTKSPGLLRLPRTRKLPSFPLSISIFSAALPLICPWNHLQK